MNDFAAAFWRSVKIPIPARSVGTGESQIKLPLCLRGWGIAAGGQPSNPRVWGAKRPKQ